MHDIVKITHNDDGDKVDEPKWCFSMTTDGSPRTLCTGECFGPGEGNAKYKEKTVVRGGITCHDCLVIIKNIKSIKL